VLLGAAALLLLAEAAQRGSWVYPGGRAGEPLKNLYKPWGRICKAAGVGGVRPHDLRHGYVSIGAVGGESLAGPAAGRIRSKSVAGSSRAKTVEGGAGEGSGEQGPWGAGDWSPALMLLQP